MSPEEDFLNKSYISTINSKYRRIGIPVYGSWEDNYPLNAYITKNQKLES